MPALFIFHVVETVNGGHQGNGKDGSQEKAERAST